GDLGNFVAMDVDGADGDPRAGRDPLHHLAHASSVSSNSTRALTAASASVPSAVIRISWSLATAALSTWSGLLASAGSLPRVRFWSWMSDSNSLAFRTKVAAGRACRPTSLVTFKVASARFMVPPGGVVGEYRGRGVRPLPAALHIPPPWGRPGGRLRRATRRYPAGWVGRIRWVRLLRPGWSTRLDR